jgi:hypothetical protein
MAVMAASVGVPMRVSVGYLPGRILGDWRVVTGAQSHMWPEAYYPELGWVAYEPTPSIGVGAVGGSAPTAAPSAEPSEAVDDRPTASPTALPTIAAPPVTGAGTGASWAAVWPWLAGTAGAAAGLGLVGWLIAWGYRRAYSPERAWRSIRRMGAQAGLIRDGMSLRAAIGALRARCPARLAGQLDALGATVELARYAAPDEAPPLPPGPRLWQIRQAVRRQLRR